MNILFQTLYFNQYIKVLLLLLLLQFIARHYVTKPTRVTSVANDSIEAMFLLPIPFLQRHTWYISPHPSNPSHPTTTHHTPHNSTPPSPHHTPNLTSNPIPYHKPHPTPHHAHQTTHISIVGILFGILVSLDVLIYHSIAKIRTRNTDAEY